jgi:hypothetical protein
MAEIIDKDADIKMGNLILVKNTKKCKKFKNFYNFF